MKSYPSFNQSELSEWLKRHGAALIGPRVQRVFIPVCHSHPQGFFRKEWCLELKNQKATSQFLFSTSSSHCTVGYYPVSTQKEKVFQVSTSASRSPFDLALAQKTEGKTIQDIQIYQNDRILKIDFQAPNPLSLWLILIPAQSEAFLVESEKLITSTKHPLTKSYFHKLSSTPPLAQSTFTIRELHHHEKDLHQWREQFALAQQIQETSLQLDKKIKSSQKKIHSLQTQYHQATQEPNWNYYGQMLLAQIFEIEDATTGEKITIPLDPKLTTIQNAERYFKLSKRNKAKIEESKKQLQQLQEQIQKFTLFKEKLASGSMTNLTTDLAFNQSLGLTQTTPTKLTKHFEGYSFTSKEGLSLLVGRNLNENLELTFKIARGNDLWMHVKNKTGAHVIILLPPKKTASLETLLDAAYLCIYFSGGKNWGKTEVDYTFRKYVKKIKGQKEVIYTQNKTLAVTLDQNRLNELLGV